MEFGILIPGIPLHEKSQKECALKFNSKFTHGETPYNDLICSKNRKGGSSETFKTIMQYLN